MSNRRLVLWIILVLFTLGVLTGCSTFGQYFGGKWVAKVNGENISVDDFNKRLEKVKETYTQQGLDFNSEQGKQMLEAVKKQTVDDMVTEKLIIQEATKQNLTADDAKVQAEIQRIKENFKTADGKIDEAKYLEALKSYGLTEADLKISIVNSLTANALFDKVTSDVTVSDADIQKYYDDNKSSFAEPEQVKARHILLNTEAEAKAIIAQLNSGADFVELAKTKSIEPAAKDSGGDLGSFTKGEMVAEFETAAFEQQVGTISKEPVKTEFGYHVILVEEHKPEVLKTFEQVKDQIKEGLPQNKKEEKFSQYLTELKDKAKIEYAPEYSPTPEKK